MKITSSTSSTSIIGVMFMSDCARSTDRFHQAPPCRRVRHRSVKRTVTVISTGTGTPFSNVGVNCHWRTASSAA